MKTSWKSKPFTLEAQEELKLLGENIRVARCRRDLSVTDFAKRMGVNRKVIEKLEQGDPTVSLGAFIQALSLLGLIRGLSQFVAPENDIEETILEARKFRTRRERRLKKGAPFSPDELDF